MGGLVPSCPHVRVQVARLDAATLMNGPDWVTVHFPMLPRHLYGYVHRLAQGGPCTHRRSAGHWEEASAGSLCYVASPPLSAKPMIPRNLVTPSLARLPSSHGTRRRGGMQTNVRGPRLGAHGAKASKFPVDLNMEKPLPG